MMKKQRGTKYRNNTLKKSFTEIIVVMYLTDTRKIRYFRWILVHIVCARAKKMRKKRFFLPFPPSNKCQAFGMN